jgi:hypothetical protein
MDSSSIRIVPVIVHSGEECLAVDLDNDGFVREKLFSALPVLFQNLTVEAVRLMRRVLDCKRLLVGCWQALRDGILGAGSTTDTAKYPSIDRYLHKQSVTKSGRSRLWHPSYPARDWQLHGKRKDIAEAVDSS